MNLLASFSLAALVINLALALYGLLLNPSGRSNRVFAFGFFFVVIWNFADAMMRISDNPHEALFWANVMCVATFFLPSSLLHFSLILTDHPFVLKGNKFLFIYIPSVIFSLTSIDYVQESVILTQMGYDYTPGRYFVYFSLLFVFVNLASVYVIYRKFSKSPFIGERTILKTIILGSLFALTLGVFTNFFSRILGMDTPKLGTLLSIVVSATLLYAIRKYRYLVFPIIEKRREGPPRFRLDKGCGYIVKEESPGRSYEIFFDLVSHGIAGIAMTRTQPSRLRIITGLEKTPVFWLTTMKGESNIDPIDIARMLYVLSSFLKESSDGVVLLEGLEYLIYNNNFVTVLKFIHNLNDYVAVSNSRLLLSLHPRILSPMEFALIEKEMVSL